MFNHELIKKTSEQAANFTWFHSQSFASTV